PHRHSFPTRRSSDLTVKMPGADAITRVKINHPRSGPVLDLSVYAGTELEGPLAAIKGELGLRYETDVQRLMRQVRGRHGSVELADRKSTRLNSSHVK